ncbi:MAG: DUF4012 domain-containing protein [Candidatus Spechtbacteria bacterium]|nr:DUF4012 domain-containing protein [Candidatus Spechtbacteria bacterium]
MNPEHPKGDVDASDIFSFSQKRDSLRWRSQIYRKKVDVREIAEKIAFEERVLERAKVEKARAYYASHVASFVAKKKSQIVKQETGQAITPAIRLAPKKLLQTKAGASPVEARSTLVGMVQPKICTTEELKEPSRLEVLQAMQDLDSNDAKLREVWSIAKREESRYGSQQTFNARQTPTNFNRIERTNSAPEESFFRPEKSLSIVGARQDIELSNAKQEALAYFSHNFIAPENISENVEYHRASFYNKATARKQKRHFPSSGFIVSSVVMMCLVLTGGAWANGMNVKDDILADATEAYTTLNDAQEAAKGFRFNEAAVSFSKAYEQFVQAEQSINSMGKGFVAVISMLPFESKPRSGVYLIQAGAKLSRAGERLSSVAGVLTASVMPMDTAKEESAAPLLSTVILKASESALSAQQDLADAKTYMDKVSASDLPAEYRDQFLLAKERIATMRGLFTALSSYSDGVLTFLGDNNPKTYLVIFQNSAEIRATGGFVGTYGVMKLSKGEMTSLFVDGIYNADGQLTVKIIPPKPIEYVSTAWSMHDSNWFFDFPTSAEKIMWFYEKTGGETPDGVIALTPAVVERLLRIVGPISLPQYNLTVSAQNFSDIIQQQVEVNYDKKENAPKKVLADMTPILMDKVNMAFADRAPEILDALAQSLQQKDIMMYSRDNEVEKIFNDQGWSGKVTAPLAAKPNEIQDFFAVVYSNIGGYKTDKVTTTKEEVATTVQDDGSINRVIRVTRSHNGGSTPYDWYNKPNVDYMRFYAPLGSQLVRAQGFSEAPQISQFDYRANDFKGDVLVESTGLGARRDSASGTDIFQENSMQVFGNWMIVRPGKVQTVEIEYTIPRKMTDRTSYFLSKFAQAGIFPSVDLKFDVGAWGNFVWCSEEGATSATLNVFRDSLYGDRHIGCVIEKK